MAPEPAAEMSGRIVTTLLTAMDGLNTAGTPCIKKHATSRCLQKVMALCMFQLTHMGCYSSAQVLPADHCCVHGTMCGYSLLA